MLLVAAGQGAPELYFTWDTQVINVGQFQVPFRCNRCFVGSCDLCFEGSRVPRAVPRGGIGEECQQFAVKREWAEASDEFGVFRVGEAPRVVFVER